MVPRTISIVVRGLKVKNFAHGMPALCLAKEDAEQAGRFGGLEPATVTRPRPCCRSGSSPATHARAGRASTALSPDRSLSVAC